MKSLQSGTKITAGPGLNYVVTGVTARKFTYVQSVGAAHQFEMRAWKHQVNGRAGAPRSYGALQNFSVVE